MAGKYTRAMMEAHPDGTWTWNMMERTRQGTGAGPIKQELARPFACGGGPAAVTCIQEQ